MIHKTVDITVPGYQETAHLTIYALDNSIEMDPDRTRPLVLICGGGGYEFVSDREKEPLACQFLAMGYHAATLDYSVHPEAHYPTSLLQLAASVKYLKEHAREYNINPNAIVVQGSSAGGHLAASFGCFWNRAFVRNAVGAEDGELRPAGLMLSYPVITSGPKAHRSSFTCLLGDRYDELVDEVSLENQVSEDVPRTFLWHTAPDDVVPVENSICFTQALLACGVSVELHVYPVGGHGLALATDETHDANGYAVQKECASWIKLAQTWMEAYRN